MSFGLVVTGMGDNLGDDIQSLCGKANGSGRICAATLRASGIGHGLETSRGFALCRCKDPIHLYLE